MFNKREEVERGPTHKELDMMIKAMKQSPICPRCGASIQGVPVGQVIQCPVCRNHARHRGGIWLEYVSPLSLEVGTQSVPMGARNFRFTK